VARLPINAKLSWVRWRVCLNDRSGSIPDLQAAEDRTLFT
jgi:hypothetical protein